MLRSRAEIAEDKYFGPLTEAILERDQPRTTDLFFRMVARDGRSIGDALSVVTAAEAPVVQVPSHINIKDGQVSLGNSIMKADANKIRRLADGKVITGFAGSSADAFALLDRFDAKLDRRAARGTGGVGADGRTLGAESVGQVLQNRAEQEAFIKALELAGPGRAQHIVVGDGLIGAGRRDQGDPLRPFHFARREGEEQRAWEIAPRGARLLPDCRLGQRLLGPFQRG